MATALDERCDAVEAADRVVDAAVATERTGQRKWRAQYGKDHGLLEALFPTDKARVESFSKPSGSVKRSRPPPEAAGAVGNRAVGADGTPILLRRLPLYHLGSPIRT